MPTADNLLPLCIALGLLGVVVAVIAFARGRRGRGLQAVGFALASVALYLTGLLRLVWNAVVAVVRWATGTVFDLTAFIGFGVLALSIVLWAVGGVLGRRRRRIAKAAPPGSGAQAVTPGATAVKAQPAGRSSAKQPAGPAQDEEMAEIEALLRSRGIQ